MINSENLKKEIFPKCEFLEHNNCKLDKNYNFLEYFLPLSQPRVQGTFHNSEPYPYLQSLEMFEKKFLNLLFNQYTEHALISQSKDSDKQELVRNVVIYMSSE